MMMSFTYTVANVRYTDSNLTCFALQNVAGAWFNLNDILYRGTVLDVYRKRSCQRSYRNLNLPLTKTGIEN